MASSSSTTPRIYDVFLGFRGEDTRNGFVSHLYDALSNEGIRTFMDDNIRKGTELGPELERAIEGSRISVVIFSTNYASSRWCLNELVKIMECRRIYGQQVMPVFYDVDPSEVRHQSCAIGESLKKLAQSCQLYETHNVLRSWKEALTEVANLPGFVATNRNESELVSRIVEDISRRLDDDLWTMTDCQSSPEQPHKRRRLSVHQEVLQVLSEHTSKASSSSKTKWIYDVFLSFRGEDTRNGIVSHLYDALSNEGIRTFIDDNIHKGTELGPELERAIEGSWMSIVILSHNYASSRWCLNELVKIMECRRIYGQVVLPLFYHVDPSDVRRHKGTIGKSLEEFARKSLVTPNVLRSWKEALTEVANLSGFHAKSTMNESTLVSKIVDGVLGRLDNDLLAIPEFSVGIESRVQQVIEFLENHSGTGCVVGIWGMGGLGKTTIAKFIYNRIYRHFKHRKFIENIREVCEKDSRGCISLQEQLLSGLLQTKGKIHSIADGISMIQRRLSAGSNLIVLDDLTKSEQLKALCGNCKWIDGGSALIITTRDVRLLNLLKADYIYKVEEMNKDESLELFSWHAFREASPRPDLIKLSVDIVAYCGGLPLALEVLGSYLFERMKEEWEDVLSKLKKIPEDQVQEKLKISYDGLDEYGKKIFLDICFFFIGKNRADVTYILKGCDLHPEIGITILVERSLVMLDKNNKLQMHDLLRDMGREIVRRSFPEEPEKRSRLWDHQEVLEVLSELTGRKAIEGLALKLQRTNGLHFNTKAFKKMKKLRLLQLDHVQFVGDYKYFNKNLRWVCWQGFPLKHMPDNLYLEKVISVELKYSNITQVWKEAQLLERLKILNLSHSKKLRRTPDFSKLPNLEKLILKDCPSLSEVHQSIGDLTNLLVINLKDCTSLSNLPRRVYQLKSLKTLILSGCSKIDKLEDDIVRMESLTTLVANGTAVKEMPRSIVRLKSIGYISLCGHEGLASDIFPSLVWSWMSPTANLGTYTQPCRSMSTSLISTDIWHNNLGDLRQMLRGHSKHRSILVQFDSKFETQKLRRIMDDLCDVRFTELESTSYASQISENSMESYLIRMGSYNQVDEMLSESISEGLKTNDSSDFSLPGDNYPYWLVYIGQGHSVQFQLPDDRDCWVKGMILCVVYSSTSRKMAVECLAGILIVNHTKCTIQIFKRESILSFNDEDWQGIISNLRANDGVEIFVAYGHGTTVMKTAVYILY